MPARFQAPSVAPETIGPSYSSCVPAGSSDSTAAAAANPSRRPLASATAVSPVNPSRGPVSPHAPSMNRHGAPKASSITARIAPT